jgi:hypothetical protein
MIRDAKCEECGGSNWDKSELESRGEISCKDCGVVQEQWKFVSAPAPLREGDDTRPGGPSRRAASIVRLDPTLREGDIVWNLPPGRKRAICDEKRGGCGNRQLLEELDDVCGKCGSNTLWRFIYNPKSLPLTKDIEWIYKRQAKTFLGLGRNDNEDDLSEDIKDLVLNHKWIELVVDTISNPGLPDRAPEEEE